MSLLSWPRAVAVVGVLMGAGSQAQAAPHDPCALVARLQAAAVSAIKAPAPDPEAAAAAAKAPALALEGPIGRCWATSGGGAWGLVVGEVVASWSSYERGAVELNGALVAVHVDAQGVVTQASVGAFTQGPSCETSVVARPVTPSQQALLVTIDPDCHEAATRKYGAVVAWREGKLAATATSTARGPLVSDDDVAERVWTWRYGTLEFPGGLGGTFARSMRIPLSIAADGELAFDASARAALEAECAGHAVASVALDEEGGADSDDLVTAIGCDWVRGADVSAALKRVLAACGKPPAKVAKQSAFDREVAVFEWAAERQPQCALVESAWALLKSAPPVRLGAGGAEVATGDAHTLKIARAAVSSAVPAITGYTFGGSNLIDGALDTSWQPRSRRPHRGAWARLELAAPARVTAVVIANGFQREDALGDLFVMNDRVATGTLTFDDGPAVPFTLDATTRGRVTIPLPTARTTRQVTLTMTSSHPGSRWEQVAISELALLGTAP